MQSCQGWLCFLDNLRLPKMLALFSTHLSGNDVLSCLTLLLSLDLSDICHLEQKKGLSSMDVMGSVTSSLRSKLEADLPTEWQQCSRGTTCLLPLSSELLSITPIPQLRSTSIN